MRIEGVAVGVFVLASAMGADFDRSSASRAVGFAGSAYCAGTLGKGVNEWNCHSCLKLGPGGADGISATEFHDAGVFATDQNGFVAWDPFEGPSGSIVVSFTGTDPLSLQNYLDDLDFVPVDYPLCAGCKVDQGFWTNWRNVQAKVLALVDSYLAQHPAADVRITGHSLGGAVALLAALHLQSQGVVPVVALQTFGEPRAGNDALAAFAQQQLGGRHWRLTHRRDPIPHLPPKGLLGAVHTETEVFFQSRSNGSFVVCDGPENATCSDRYVADVLLTDHLFYLDFDFISNYLYCKL